MANAATLSSSEDGNEDIGLRLSRLNLPQKPLIMEKLDRHNLRLYCPHPPGNNCFCHEYTTFLDRPEYAGKWLASSPEPEPPKPQKKLNGTAVPKKKFTLGQYSALAGKTIKKAPGSSTPVSTAGIPNGTSRSVEPAASKPNGVRESRGPASNKANGVKPSALPPPPPPTSKQPTSSKAPPSQAKYD